MSKFRTWLIKKLGGQVVGPQLKFQVTHMAPNAIKVCTEMKFDVCDVDVDQKTLKSYAKEKMVHKLVNILLEDEVIHFSSEKDINTNKYIYRAECYVYKEKV